MSKPEFYQKVANTEVNSRTTYSVTDAQKASINTTINIFICSSIPLAYVPLQVSRNQDVKNVIYFCP